MHPSFTHQSAPTFSAISADGDKELVQLCRHFNALEQALQLLWNEDDDDLWMLIESKQKKLVDKIHGVPPKTLAGFQAIARAITGWTEAMSDEEIGDLTGVDADLLTFFLRSLVQMPKTTEGSAVSVTHDQKSDDLEPAYDSRFKYCPSNKPFTMMIDFGQKGPSNFRSAAAACRFFQIRRGELARMRARTGESWETLIRKELTNFYLRDEAEAPQLVAKYPRSATGLRS